MRVGWGQENVAFRQLFTSQFIPGGTKEQEDWFNELQRISASPEDAVRTLIAASNIDVSALLGQVTVPTLVMHAHDDARVPFEFGRQLAASIPGEVIARQPRQQLRVDLVVRNFSSYWSRLRPRSHPATSMAVPHMAWWIIVQLGLRV